MFFLIALAVLCVTFLLFKSVAGVNPERVMVLERKGKFHRVLGPGLHFTIPFLDAPRRVAWPANAEEKTTLPAAESIAQFFISLVSKDGKKVKAEVLVFFQLEDPVKAAYHVPALGKTLEQTLKNTLRASAALLTERDMCPDENAGEAFRSESPDAKTEDNRNSAPRYARMHMRAETEKKLKEEAYAWGLVVHRVEILALTPDPELTPAA